MSFSSKTPGVADLDYEFSLDLFEKSNLKLIFGYVQNHHSYLDSATPDSITDEPIGVEILSYQLGSDRLNIPR